MIYKSEKEIAKNGSLVPVFTTGRLMHSKYNPQNEAVQFAKAIDKADLFIILGLGGGYHIEAIQNAHPNAKIIVAENSFSDINTLLEIPLVKNLSQSIIFCTKENIAQTILSVYNPLLFERFSVISQRAWAQNYPELDTTFRAIINATLKNVSADYSVQAHFGRHWHRNIIENIKFLSTHSNAPLPLSNGKTAAIIAAGPSLDKSAKKINANRENYFVIATDTAFSALHRRGIYCDVVISIDAQNISYKHFMCIDAKENKRTLFVFDLSSPPSSIRKIAQLGFPIHFTINRHPLSQLASQFFPFMTVESGAGTVTIAAADFARQIGFTQIELFGADFAYSLGKPYTKGTYLDSIYRESEKRIDNTETKYTALMYRTELMAKADGVFTTPILESYKSTMEFFFSQNNFYKVNENTYKAKDSIISKEPCEKFYAKKFPYQEFIHYLLSQTKKNIETNSNSDKNIFNNNCVIAHLPAMAAIKSKQCENNAIFTLLKLAYSATVRYTT